VRVAVAQIEPRLGDSPANLDSCCEAISQAAAAEAELVVLPECALSGYLFAERAAAFDAAHPIPGLETETLERVCRATGVSCVLGILERSGGELYNSALALGPDGVVGLHRKTHLPVLGVDRFVVPGDKPPPVLELAGARVGIEICYELRFPEVTRSLALAGAELIVNPTNWPPNASALADFFIRTRAAENRVWIVAANRVGTEAGGSFIGRSQVVDPSGMRIAELDQRAGLLTVELDPADAHEKDLIMAAGDYEVHLFADRRPELYRELTRTRE
jgi:predicted amidohydrolase